MILYTCIIYVAITQPKLQHPCRNFALNVLDNFSNINNSSNINKGNHDRDTVGMSDLN